MPPVIGHSSARVLLLPFGAVRLVSSRPADVFEKTKVPCRTAIPYSDISSKYYL